MERPTVNQLVLDALRRHPRPDLLWHKQAGSWQKISSQVFLRRVASVASFLKEKGIAKGDRVALFSENRPEWHIADLAILGLGAINVPIYAGEGMERLRYILNHSEARLCFLSGPDQFDKVKTAWAELPRLERVVAFGHAVGEPPAGREVVAWEQVVRDDVPDSAVEEFERTARAHGPDDVASLIYTSGTTGTPKGALLTQHNFGSNVAGCVDRIGVGTTDLAMSLLPLCHIYERTLDYGYLAHGVPIAYAESFDKVVENMREVQPTVMAVVPRFFEKFYTRLTDALRTAPALKRKLFEWAQRVGAQALPCRLAGKPFPFLLGLRYQLAEWLAYRKLRAQLGGRIERFISGGGPLARDLNEFFHSLGLTIYEGYGLTETSPVIAVSVPGATKLGTVGRPIPGVEVKIAEDGEILTRGPHVMKGYYKMEAETSEVLRDGWFATGDVGFLDEEGFLTITDRKKDLIKTAGGKYIAPQAIENQLKQSPYIQSAVVVGDRRKYAAALLVPNFPNLESQAAQLGISAGCGKELIAHPEIRALLDQEVEKVNRGLAQYERLKRFALLEEDFSFDNGQLTYTQKVRRRKIEERYRAIIDRLYDEEPRPAA